MTTDGKEEGRRRQALVEAGDFEGAIASIDEEIRNRPNEKGAYRTRSRLHLYLGHTMQARADLDMNEAIEEEVFRTPAGKLQCDLEYNATGITYWMEKHREIALAFWRYTTRSLFTNRVQYAQTGGGIGSGQLLWFGAVHEKIDDDVELVRRFYEKRLTSTHWSHNLKRWPGPIVHFFLKHIDERELMEAAADHRNNLCEANFALAIRARENGRHAAYRKHLKLCAPGENNLEIYNYYNILPYFLARFELGAIS